MQYGVIPCDNVWCSGDAHVLTKLYFWLIVSLPKNIVILWNLVRVTNITKTIFLLPNRALLLSGNMSLPMGLTVARVRVKDLSRVEPNTEHKTKLYAWYINIWNYTLASMCEVTELYKNTTQNFKVQVTTFPSSIMYKCAIQNQQLDSMLYATYRTLNVFII